MNDDWPDYELIDFGAGRRLERFGEAIFERPCPAASSQKGNASAWREATARYDGDRATAGEWTPRSVSETTCQVPLDEGPGFEFAVSPSPAGQIGLFPEQLANWRWIAKQTARLAKATGKAPRVLNLFAYTGGSTLAAASAGAEVTHVDASKPSVAIARENAQRSGLGKTPIRWLVEDATRYVRREVKRGSRYDAVILDPPSYGHGPKGEPWRLEQNLPELLDLCGELVERAPKFFLATCHTPGVGPAELSAYLADGVFGHCGQPPASGKLWLQAVDGRRLASGVYAKWPR